MLNPYWSIRRRFAVTFATGLVRAGVSFLASIFVARSLGVSEYGNFQFLLATGLSARQFLDLGTSNAFFTLISRGDRRPKVFATYFLWIFCQLVVLLLCLLVLSPKAWATRIWLHQSQARIAVALVSAFATDALWMAVMNIGESIRRTEVGQFTRLGAVFAYALSLVAMRTLGALTVGTALALNAVVYIGASAVGLRRLIRESVETTVLSAHEADLIEYYVSFCSPLLIAAPFSFACTFADSWLLQFFAGSRAQGLYGVSNQIMVISSLATTSFIKVFHKEISEAVAMGNLDRARALLDKASRHLFLAGAAVSAMFIPLSQELVTLTLGPQYAEAVLPVTVMLLYPIHQSIGQLTGTFYFASAQMKTYAWVNVPLSLLGIATTYVALAPHAYPIPGLALGSVGVPLKQVILQLIATNTNAWAIHRLYGWRYRWTYQAVTLGTLLPVSWGLAAAIKCGMHIARVVPSPVLLLATTGLLYPCAVLLIFRLAPRLLGLNQEESHTLWVAGRSWPSKALAPFYTQP